MRKIILLINTLLFFPVRLFSKISPLAFIRGSNISNKSSIHSYTRFYNSSISAYSYLGRNCFVNNSEIGKFCSVADNCSIGLLSHPTDWVSTSPVFYKGSNRLKKHFANLEFNSSKRTIIENDVWIGMNVCIMAGIRIETGAIIGAGAVITKDIGAYEIWVGNPAKCIRKRFDYDTILKLLDSKWWNWNNPTITSFANDFSSIDKFIKKLEYTK